MIMKQLKKKLEISVITLLLFLFSFSNINAQGVVTQTESVESNFFPMPGWKARKGIIAEFSKILATTSVSPVVPALTSGTYSTGGLPAVVGGGGTNIVTLNSFTVGSDTAYIISKPFDFSNNGGTNPTFSFWVYRDNGFSTQNDRIEVFWSAVSPGPGASLTAINHQGGNNIIPRFTGSLPTAINGNGWYEYKFTLPAATYSSKRNYFVIRGITALGNNMYLDNFVCNTYPSAMNTTDVQMDLVQQNAATTSAGATNQWILGVRCVINGNSGCGNLNATSVNLPVKLDSLLFNTNGSSNINTDILNAKVFYTGGYDQFNSNYVSPFPVAGIPSTTYPKTTYGSVLTGAQIATNLDFINNSGPCFYLEYDTTYFWLVYDIKPTALGSNFLDGDFRGGVVGGPTTCPSPVGSLTCTQAITSVYSLIGSCQVDIPYCIPTYTVGTSWQNGSYTNNDYVQSVSLIGYGGTAINASVNAVSLQLPGLYCYPNCNFTRHPPDYEFRNPTTPSNTVTLQQGATYNITVQVGTWSGNNAISAWIDFNRDGTFNNSQMTWSGALGTSTWSGERLGYASLSANGTATWTFTVPTTGALPVSFQGTTRLRVREIFLASSTSMTPCDPANYGECEDFVVTIIPNCSPSFKLWLGNTDDWNNPANWCPSIPTITDSAVINRTIVNPGTRVYKYPVIKSGIFANAKSLTISNQDSLYIDADSPSVTPLKISGNLNNNGFINVIGNFNPINNAVFPNSTGTLLNFLMTPLCGKTYKAAQTQIIYLASDLAQLGMMSGDRITAIQLNVKNNDLGQPIRTYQNFTIGYSCNGAVPISFTQTVPLTITNPNIYTNAFQPIVFGTNTFTLATPIVWDGVSNLVIQYTFSNPTSTGSLNNDYIDITASTGRNSTLILGRVQTSIQTIPAVGSFVGQVTGDITSNGATVANTLNTINALSTLRPNTTFFWDRPYGKPKLVVQGNFTNNGRFNPGKSLFVMDSSVTQFISGTRAIPFYTFSMNKTGLKNGIFLNNDTVSIQDTFFLGQGQFIMNGKPLFMTWNNPRAFSRIVQGTSTAGTGVLISENPNSLVNWTIGGYVSTLYRAVPFGNRMDTANGAITYIPFGFIHKSGDLGTFKVGTKYWLSNNLPDPPTVTHINLFNSPTPNPGNTVDRYWMIGKTGPQNPSSNFASCDLIFKFSTNATLPQVTERPSTMSSLPPRPGWAQPWRQFGLQWLRISSLATLNVSIVNSAVGNGSVITYTTSVAHTFVPGQYVTISGAMTPIGYNLTNVMILSTPTTTTFTVSGVQTGVSSLTSTATGLTSNGGTPYTTQQTTLNYVQSYNQFAASNLDSVRVVSWDWPVVPTGVAPYFVPSGPIGDFGPWTIAVNSIPLPIELLDFKAYPQGDIVKLEWATASEVDNDYFTVERSTNSSDFTYVDRIKSHTHNSNIILNYNTYDEQPLKGLQYYRLKQTDFNGEYTYSKLQPVWFGDKSVFEIINVFPEYTSQNNINVWFNSDSENPIQIEITDASGKVVYSQIENTVINGVNKIMLNVNLVRGMYFITLKNKEKSISKKFIY
jgi:hypothetical protein